MGRFVEWSVVRVEECTFQEHAAEAAHPTLAWQSKQWHDDIVKHLKIQNVIDRRSQDWKASVLEYFACPSTRQTR